MNETFTAVLAVATVAYAWFTYQAVRSSRDAVRAMRDQEVAITRPYVTVAAFPEPETPLLVLTIRNDGKTAAQGLTLRLDRSFYQFGEQREDRDISKFRAFQEPIASLPPGAELRFYLASSQQVLGVHADTSVTPCVFSVTAAYSFAGRRVQEGTVIDLHAYWNAAIDTDRRVAAVVAALEKVSSALDRLSRHVS